MKSSHSLEQRIVLTTVDHYAATPALAALMPHKVHPLCRVENSPGNFSFGWKGGICYQPVRPKVGNANFQVAVRHWAYRIFALAADSTSKSFESCTAANTYSTDCLDKAYTQALAAKHNQSAFLSHYSVHRLTFC